MDALRAFGAEVIVCPTDVDPEDPRSYYSVSSRLVAGDAELVEGQPVRQPHQRAGALRADRPGDLGADRRPHQSPGGRRRAPAARSAAPGKYLKEKNPRIKVWGIDTYGSVFKKYKETGVFDKNEIYPYVTEGIGEDFLPKNVDFAVIDHFEKVTDRDAAIMTGRDRRARRASSSATPPARRWPACCSSATTSGTGETGGGDLPRPRHALPRQDVQPRLDARDGLPRI